MNELFIFVISLSNIIWFLHLFYSANRHGFELLSPFRFILSLSIPFLIAWRAIRKRKLSLNGAILAFWIGMCSCIADITLFVSLLTFYFTSNKLTKWKASRKAQLQLNYEIEGCRDFWQVLTNGAIPYICSWLLVYECGGYFHDIDFGPNYKCTRIYLTALAAISCSCGDTWASEVGTAIGSETPRLVTNFRKVPAGTNGAVTAAGLVASVLGGLAIGLASFVSSGTSAWTHELMFGLTLFCSFSGFIGSMVDSYLGALLQYSGVDQRNMKVANDPSSHTLLISGVPILSNNAVNAVSTFLTSVLIMPAFANYMKLFTGKLK